MQFCPGAEVGTRQRLCFWVRVGRRGEWGGSERVGQSPGAVGPEGSVAFALSAERAVEGFEQKSPCPCVISKYGPGAVQRPAGAGPRSVVAMEWGAAVKGRPEADETVGMREGGEGVLQVAARLEGRRGPCLAIQSPPPLGAGGGAESQAPSCRPGGGHQREHQASIRGGRTGQRREDSQMEPVGQGQPCWGSQGGCGCGGGASPAGPSRWVCRPQTDTGGAAFTVAGTGLLLSQGPLGAGDVGTGGQLPREGG